jgi:hypothetical protein
MMIEAIERQASSESVETLGQRFPPGVGRHWHPGDALRPPGGTGAFPEQESDDVPPAARRPCCAHLCRSRRLGAPPSAAKQRNAHAFGPLSSSFGLARQDPAADWLKEGCKVDPNGLCAPSVSRRGCSRPAGQCATGH